MPHFTRFGIIRGLLVPILALLLVLAVACGPAAAPETTAPATSAPAPAATAAPSAPTAVPEAMSEPAAAEVVVHPGTLTWLSGNFGDERFDRAFSAGAVGHDYALQVHALLLSTDVENGRRVIIPGIATQWGISADGLTWTFTIRDGVMFHDGTELTAEDAFWTLQHLMGPQASDYTIAGLDKYIQNIDRIEQPAPNQVSVTTKLPIAEFAADLSEAASAWTGAVYPKRATLHNIEEEKAYDQNPIGAGIMRLVKHVPAAQMILERFDDYYQPDKRVKFTQFDLRLVPEEATRVAALRTGEGDIAPVTIGARKQVEAGGGRLIFSPEGMSFSLRQQGCWSDPSFPCHDKRVRQALNYAIDKELIRDQLYGGPEVMQIKGFERLGPSFYAYSPELDPYPFDPDKARQLLAEAGYPDGSGFGELIVNTFVSSALPLMPEAAQLVADFWRRELGLDVEVKIGESASLKKAAKLTPDLYGQILMRDAVNALDGGAYMRGQWGTADRNDRQHNDPELFAQVNQALTVFEPEERKRVVHETLLRMREEANQINLGYINIPWGVGPRVVTWEPYPLAPYPSALHTVTLK